MLPVAEITDDAIFEYLRFSDVNDRAVYIFHHVNARFHRQFIRLFEQLAFCHIAPPFPLFFPKRTKIVNNRNSELRSFTIFISYLI